MKLKSKLDFKKTINTKEENKTNIVGDNIDYASNRGPALTNQLPNSHSH